MSKPNISSTASEDNCSIPVLTCYEGEINEIKRLTQLSSSKNLPTNTEGTFLGCSHQQHLSTDLHNSLKLNEKYKNDLFGVERRKDLEYHDRFEALLRRNAQLEAQIKTANIHIEQLIGGKHEYSKEHNLMSENTKLLDEVEQLRNSSSSYEMQIQRLDSCIRELNDELDVKTTCIGELKSKIASQHVELTKISSMSSTFEQNVMQNEINRLEKMCQWYAEQLHNCQTVKNNYSEELLNAKHQLDKSNTECNKLRSQITDMKINSENLNALCKSQSAKITELELNYCASLPRGDEFNMEALKIKFEYENKISDLLHEISVTKSSIKEQTRLYEKINKENGLLTVENVALVKDLMERNAEISNLKMCICDLNKKCEQLSALKLEISRMQLILEATNREKTEISEAITLIRSDFNRLNKLHASLGLELLEKAEKIREKNKKIKEMDLMHNTEMKKFTTDNSILTKQNESYESSLKNLKEDLEKLQCYKTTIDILCQNDISDKSNMDSFSRQVLRNLYSKLLMKLMPKKQLIFKLGELKQRCSLLSTKCSENATLLAKLTIPTEASRIMHMQSMLKVKDLQLQEQQKRHEKNNRTLLRKIKQHMQSRNMAESHCNYLEELQESAMKSLNDVKVQLERKNSELEELQNINESIVQLSNATDDFKQAGTTKSPDTVYLKDSELQEIEKKNQFLQEEIRVLQTDLCHKNEEFNGLKSNLSNWKVENAHREKQLLLLISRYEEEMQETRDNLKILTGEKYFLQRLSNDLKIALNSTVNQNQVLKEQISNQFNDSGYHSLPDFATNLPSPGMFDNCKIQRLLLLTNELREKNPTVGLSNGINTLKQQMAILQEEIAKKKCARK